MSGDDPRYGPPAPARYGPGPQPGQYPSGQYGAAPAGPGGPGSGGPGSGGSGGPSRSGDPARSKLIAIFVGLGLVGLLIGVGAAELRKGGNSTTTAGIVSPAETSSGAPQQPVASTGPTPSPTPSPTATKPPNYTPIPQDAAADKDLDFGFLIQVLNADGTVTLRFDRATFYTGADAIKHNKGKAPDDDYLIENTNPAIRKFTLDPKASIIATSRLAPSATGIPARTTLTAAQFVPNAQAALKTSSGPLPVWLRHTNGLTGPVTALLEQYLP